ncbi:phosphatase PAP2 family protein [Halosimplex litoreum]|uniref:Phosphatase PAP2 family protein n=1 Tax=Halosimplex litoreum TaxID=1198301 RepID=A0A7T3KUQ5_9EURY|nr:phosphatase PAP2 family protein [Halosimplex litoreum]QPV62010.1 phosphatase PAP2 family protein [Halosimplex litoreum]
MTALSTVFGRIGPVVTRGGRSDATDGLAIPVGQQLAADGLDAVLAVDRAAVDLVLAVRRPLLTKFMTSVTGIGSAASVAVLLGLFYLAGWKREFALAGVALVPTGIVVVTLMGAVQRPFPPSPVCMTGDTGMAPHSFPSGHAAAATVYALVARRSAVLPFAVVTGLAALVAVSRIYLGTHYLSDTVAGVAIGVGGFALALVVLDRFGDRLPPGFAGNH